MDESASSSTSSSRPLTVFASRTEGNQRLRHSGVRRLAHARALHDVFTALTVAYDLLGGGLRVLFVGVMFLPRVHKRAAIASTALGSALVVALLIAKGPESELPIYAGLAGSPRAFALTSLAAAGALAATVAERSQS